MSEVVWRRNLTPGPDVPVMEFSSPYYQDKFSVPRTKALDFNEREANLPDRRAFRTMSRAAMMLSVIGVEAKPLLEETLLRDPFKVGIYAAFENGPADSASAYDLRGISQETYAVDYKKNRNPTMYLKQLPNLAAAHLGIFLGVFGPMNVFTDSEFGSVHALEQAELDLQTGLVDLAIVGSAYAFENPITVGRNYFSGDRQKTICEGAGLLVLKKSGQVTKWSEFKLGQMTEKFGIADQIIEINERGLSHAN